MSTSAADGRKSKALPKLSLEAFQQAKAGLPLAPSPSTVKPVSIVDANVSTSVNDWKEAAGPALLGGTTSLVLHVQSEDEVKLISQLPDLPIAALIVPFVLSSGAPSKIPAYLQSPSIPVALSTSWVPGSGSSANSTLAEGVGWALKEGVAVDIDIKWDVRTADAESSWEELLSIIDHATKSVPEGTELKPIILSNILPPPHSLTIPIVKLLSAPTYQSYQSHVGDLSFVRNLYLKFLPPSWTDPTPPSPSPMSTFAAASENAPTQPDSQEKAEWKRRIKMFMGPAIDAFGYERIIFGTSPSSASTSPSTPNDWYAIAREVIAELGVDQPGIDSIFGGTAKKVYAKDV